MAVFHDAHNASRFGLGLLVLEGCWPFVSWVPGCILSDAAFSCAAYRCRTPSLLCGGTDGPAGAPLRPILAPRWAPGLPQHWANFTISLLRAGSIQNISVPPG